MFFLMLWLHTRVCSWTVVTGEGFRKVLDYMGLWGSQLGLCIIIIIYMTESLRQKSREVR